MAKPPIPPNEGTRLRALRSYDVLDTPPEDAFDRITRIARWIAGTPIALISLVDEDRQWFKSRIGLNHDESTRDISFCAHAIAAPSAPLDVPDARADPRFADNPYVTGEAGVRFYHGVPLQAPEGEAVGTLCVLDREPRGLSDEQQAMLNDLAMIATRELESRRMALTDPMTGAFNRRMLTRIAEPELARATRTGTPFCYATFDLDRFKDINDSYGHAVGDGALVATTRTCFAALRRGDLLFRLGGEEFGILLADTDLAGAAEALERLRESIAAQEIPVEGESLRITASFGVAVHTGSEDSFDAMMARADAALYKAKSDGRNRVVRAD